VEASAPVRRSIDGRPGGEVPADDRGLLYADGVFRTLRVRAGRASLWARQLDRLLHDAGRLGLRVGDGFGEVLARDLAALAGDEDGVARITLTRGGGPRGYAPPAGVRPRRLVAFAPGPLPALDLAPVRVQLARTALAWSPALAGIKHLGRGEQVLAASEPAAAEVFDRLMCDPEGRPVCGTRCNLFLRRGPRVLTPRVDRCGVAGLVRELVLGGLVPDDGDPADAFAEARPGLRDLLAADEVLLTNAVFGLRAVRELLDADGHRLAAWSAPGPFAARLAAALAPSFQGTGAG
jgi:4-amino-4-deoxychorismate lyase